MTAALRPLLIIPSIELADGHCARHVCGEPGTERLYAEMANHPVEIAQLWRRENAKCIHVTDTDSFAGRDDAATLEQVIAMQKAVDIPIELVTYQASLDTVNRLLEAGVYRVAINITAWTDPEGVRQLMTAYTPSRVIFGMRSHDGMVDLGQKVGLVADADYLHRVRELGGQRIIYTEQAWEGALTGEDLTTVHRVAEAAGPTIRITMAGGIASPQHLWELQQNAPRTVDSVVIGRALYENRFPCQGIWRAIEAKLEPGIHEQAADNVQQSSISRLSS